MDLNTLSFEARLSLLDLAMLAMYADGRLAAAEDERVHRLLTAMGFGTDSERNAQYDASVGRIRQHLRTKESVRAYVTTLAQAFPAAEQRRLVHEVLSDLISSDDNEAPEERSYLSVVKAALPI